MAMAWRDVVASRERGSDAARAALDWVSWLEVPRWRREQFRARSGVKLL